MVKSELDVCWNLNDVATVTGSHIRANPGIAWFCSAHLVSGALDSGALDSGALDSGDLDSGDLDSGDLDSGDLDSGDLDSGDLDSGARFCMHSDELNLPIELRHGRKESISHGGLRFCRREPGSCIGETG
jgi:hypothetical protein